MARTKNKEKPIDAEVIDKPGQQLATVPDGQPASAGMIRLALQNNTDPDKLTKLFDLYERDMKNKAVAAFNAAMSAVQAEIPSIAASEFNKQTNSRYVSFEGLNKVIKPIYTKHGFSVSFDEGELNTAEWCRTVCEVSHKDGHSKTFHLDLPLDGKGIKGNSNMTAIHGRLSSDTYARVRLHVKIWNITVSDDVTDNDGNDATVIDGKQIEKINTIIDKIREYHEFNFAGFLKWLAVPSLDKLQKDQFDNAVAELNQRLAQAPKNAETIKEWKDWFDTHSTIDDLNTTFVPAVSKMNSTVHHAVLVFAQPLFTGAGIAYNSKTKKYEPKGAQ